MKHTESFVLLTHDPSLVIEVNLDYVLCVLSVVHRVDVYPSLLNANAQWNLEEMRPVVPIVLITGLDMVYENF